MRYAVRALRASPLVSLVAILSLALGIGSNTAIFSVINSMWLRPLAVPDPAQLVLVTDTSPARVRVWSYPVWEQIRHRPELFAGSAAWSFTQFNLASGGEVEPVSGLWASGGFFETLGVSARLGRTFTDADDRPGFGPDGPVAVISDRFWRRRFGGAVDVMGRSLRLDDVAFTIVGVTPPDFSGPEIGQTFDVITPVATEPLVRGRDSYLDSSGTTFLTIIARLKPDQSADAATTRLRAAQSQIRDATLGDIGRFGSRAAVERYLTAPFVLAPGQTGYAGARDLRGKYERPLITLMIVVVLLLLIACVNIANLLIARAIARRPELSLRLALGASRWRLVRLLTTESAVLYVLGAASGLALAPVIGGILVRQISTAADPVVLDLSLDGRVLVFTVLVTMTTTLIFGTVPAFRASAVAPMDALKQQGRTIAGSSRRALAGSLIVVQVALSLVLVVAAGLFARTLMSLAARPLGFDPAPVLVINLDAHRATNEPTQRLALYHRALEAVRRLPGVAEAGLSLTTPFGHGQFTPPIEIAGVSDTRGPVWANLISPGWLHTLQTPIVVGRELIEADRAGSPRVAVVNEAFARKFGGGTSGIGLPMTLYPRTVRALGPIEVVGIVGDAVYGSLRDPAPPTLYLPLEQFDYLTELGIRSITLSVRARRDPPTLLTKELAVALETVDPRLALTFRPLLSQVDGSFNQERVTAQLSGFFGALALLLAGIGLYGLTAFAVATRRTEIGIRMVLGAPATRVIRLVLARTALLVGAGALAGAGISLWASQYITSLIYGVDARDPLTLGASIAVLGVVAALSAWLPARRAARTDPAAVLREA